jgi:hypothetical protein
MNLLPFIKNPLKRVAAQVLQAELISLYARIGQLEQLCHRQQTKINSAAQLLINEPTEEENQRDITAKANERKASDPKIGKSSKEATRNRSPFGVRGA